MGPWWRGIVAIASAYRTKDPGFESRQREKIFRFTSASRCPPRSSGSRIRAGVDLMKPFRPKFADKNKFGQI
jgi:hypothetical protein